MKLIKKIIIFILKVKKRFFWMICCMLERKRAYVIKDACFLNDFRALILAPHSDDEWIGCSQIIKNNKSVVICNMNMNGGDSDNMHAVRYQEMKYLADKYNRQIFTVNANDRDKDLLQIIQDCQPEIVFLPFFMDWHEEHIQVMKILRNVSASVKGFQIAMYPVSLPMLPNFITHYKPLNRVALKEKWDEFLNTYKTQAFLPWKRFFANERINGAYVNQYAAEVYSIIPVEQWAKLLDNRLLTEEQKKCLKRKLNKISHVRKIMNHFYAAKEI